MNTLSHDKQLEVLRRIWRDAEGFVFLPWIDSHRRFHPGHAFYWPHEEKRIRRHLEKHDGEDLYFTPGLFEEPERRAEHLMDPACLWADIDESDPRTWDDEVPQPNIVWETSPGRWQGVWTLDEPIPNATEAGGLNQRLTQWCGADPSGYDSTQLLRVPGRPNFKPKNGPGGAEGRLRRCKRREFSAEDFAGAPEVQERLDFEVGKSDPDRLNREDLLKLYRPKLSRGCRELLRSLDFSGDRSVRLWRILTELAEAGATLDELVSICEPLGWNKHDRRGLEREASKALAKAEAKRQREEEEKAPKAGDDEEANEWGWNWFHQPRKRARWLVKDIWTEGGCGFIAGEPKSYKSWIALDMAMSVASGRPFLGEHKTTQAPVLYLQEEDSAALVQERVGLIAEGKGIHPDGKLTVDDEGRITWHAPAIENLQLRFRVHKGFVAATDEGREWLRKAIIKDGIKLCVIDTLGTTAGELDTDKAADLLPHLLNPLRKIAQETGCAIAIVHHNRKRYGGQTLDGTRGGQDMLGSTALHAWVDSALYASQVEPGVVRVRREAKLAQEFQFKLTIPRMVQNYVTGEYVYWTPGYSTGDEGEAEDNAGDSKQSETVETKKQPLPGERWAKKYRGLFGRRGKTYEEIITALNDCSSDIEQFNKALESGCIAVNDRGLYHITESIRE